MRIYSCLIMLHSIISWWWKFYCDIHDKTC